MTAVSTFVQFGLGKMAAWILACEAPPVSGVRRCTFPSDPLVLPVRIVWHASGRPPKRCGVCCHRASRPAALARPAHSASAIAWRRLSSPQYPARQFRFHNPMHVVRADMQGVQEPGPEFAYHDDGVAHQRSAMRRGKQIGRLAHSQAAVLLQAGAGEYKAALASPDMVETSPGVAGQMRAVTGKRHDEYHISRVSPRRDYSQIAAVPRPDGRGFTG